MSTTVLESDSSTTTINLTDGGGVAVGEGGVGVNEDSVGGTGSNVATTDTPTIDVGILNTEEGNSKTISNDDNSTPMSVANNGQVSEIGPISKKAKSRPNPYSKPILLTSDRTKRKKKSLTWQPDDCLKKVHYFELIPDERTNVSRMMTQTQNETTLNASTPNVAATSPNAHAKLLGGPQRNIVAEATDGKQQQQQKGDYPVFNERGQPLGLIPKRSPEWKLILIDFTPALPSPGWNSLERSAQAERETYVLGAIDLPGQPSTIDEPDNATGGPESSSKDETKIIPLDNPDGMYTEYPDMYSSDIVNGVRITGGNQPAATSSVVAFNGQTSQLLPDQFQQQLINVVQNPFTFQEMSAQFQQTQPQQFPFATQQQQQQPFQTPFVAQPQIIQPSPFMNQQPPAQQQQPLPTSQQQPQSQQSQQQQQQQQLLQPGVQGPIMPWLNYPFNQVSENSHAHLFRRPAT